MKKLILVSGGSASGKTSLAKEINSYFNENGKQSLLISQDNYYICSLTDIPILDISNYDFDQPYAIDIKHLFSDITKIIKGEEVFMPRYHFGSKPKEYNVLPSGNPDIIILEGNYVLNYEYLVNLANHKIFVDVDEHIRLERRLKRDFSNLNTHFQNHQ